MTSFTVRSRVFAVSAVLDPAVPPIVFTSAAYTNNGATPCSFVSLLGACPMLDVVVSGLGYTWPQNCVLPQPVVPDAGTQC